MCFPHHVYNKGVHATITAIVKAHNTGRIEVLVPGLRVLSRLKNPCCYGKHTMGKLFVEVDGVDSLPTNYF